MADQRVRSRMAFDVPDELKRAIRARAGMDGVAPADVIVAALSAYLWREVSLIQEHVASGSAVGRAEKRSRSSCDGRPGAE